MFFVNQIVDKDHRGFAFASLEVVEHSFSFEKPILLISNLIPMKNFIEIKTYSICPMPTPAGPIFLALPIFLMECFTFFAHEGKAEEGEYLNTTLYLN